jgi:protein-L-isoaspartate(D-aspartate) O-methyltransferase
VTAGEERPDVAIARGQMVEELVALGIRDPRVLAAMGRVPRHRFVPPALELEGYDDRPLPIGAGQTISQPFMVARMTELLRLTGTERVLEVGTGSGYQAAVLAELAAEVFTIEVLPALADEARRRLEALGYARVRVRTGDGSLGWPEAAPFDRIIVTAGAPTVPPALVAQLVEGGRLVIPVGGALGQVLQAIDKIGGATRVTDDVECVFVRLVGQAGWPREERWPARRGGG